MSSPMERDGFFTPVSLWDQLTLGVVGVDAAGLVRAVNDAAEKLLGKPRGRLIGVRLEALLPGHPVAMDLLTRARALNMPCRIRDARLNPSPERTVAVALTAVPLHTPDGAWMGAMLQMEEVGATERIEEGKRIHDALDSLGDLAMTVAHEVKNPLAGIRGAAQLLEGRASGADAACVELIRSEVDRVSRLLDDLLGLAEKQLVREKDLNIHEILDHVGRVCISSGERPAPIADYDPSLPQVRGDRDQLIQLFLNLVKNGMQAAGPDGKVRILTRFSQRTRMEQGRRRRHIEVEVRDNGPGIPEEMRQRIFLPFVSTKASGTGLGLSISQKIIQAHGGQLEMESMPGNTIFRVLLPVGSP
ncbi:MAG: PAS domain-containing protein [Magnetococcales bacterium]|nr:PAS domain-containing protein [Magnetococcales bacterium]MBF0262379.1 PAS domain-containing protein [Magnetococcales bacterium]